MAAMLFEQVQRFILVKKNILGLGALQSFTMISMKQPKTFLDLLNQGKALNLRVT